MFQKTKRQLALSYAALFLLILAALGSAIYIFFENHLFSKVDESLTSQVHLFQTNSLNSKPDVLSQFAGAQIQFSEVKPVVMDPRMFVVFQDAQRSIVTSKPAMNVEPEMLKLLIDSSAGRALATVRINGHSYRVSSSTNKVVTPLVYPLQSNVGLSTAFAIISVDSEMNMLYSLIVILAVAGGIGCILVVLAGYFMAGRALVPIRNSWERQQQFVADASHELRTPLAVMGTNAELLLRHPDHTIEQESYIIAPILKEVKRLSKLVSQLLTLARSDSNQLELQCVPLLLNEQLAESAETFRPLCDLKSIQLETELTTSIAFTGDEERLKQLTVILLDNAVKHTPEGGSIRITCGKSGSAVRFQVKDTGVGIPPKDLPLIFDRFYRGYEARNRSDGGTGLGLSIAKWISEKHGGTIQAASTLGQGTIMTVSLPLN
jgi:two-component system, OmpR family, sensor histidine kinase CiaH